MMLKVSFMLYVTRIMFTLLVLFTLKWSNNWIIQRLKLFTKYNNISYISHTRPHVARWSLYEPKLQAAKYKLWKSAFTERSDTQLGLQFRLGPKYYTSFPCTFRLGHKTWSLKELRKREDKDLEPKHSYGIWERIWMTVPSSASFDPYFDHHF